MKRDGRKRIGNRATQRASHIGRLLFELGRHFEMESLLALQQRGHLRLTQAQKQVIVNLPLAGARLTDLADRCGVTKQTMMRLVDNLEDQGYVKRVADPQDARAKSVRLTTKGRQLIDDGLMVAVQIEMEYRELLGDAEFTPLAEALRALAGKLQLHFPDSA